MCPSWVQASCGPDPAFDGEIPYLRQVAYSEGGRLASALQIELGEDMADVMLNRLRGDEESRGDLAVGQAFPEQSKDLQLASGEPPECVRASSTALASLAMR